MLLLVFERLAPVEVVPFDTPDEELVTDTDFETDAEVVVFWKRRLVLEIETVDEVRFLVDVEFANIGGLFPVPTGTKPVPVPIGTLPVPV